MSIESLINSIGEYLLFTSCLLILIGSILISIKTRFVQVRLLPSIFKMFTSSFLKTEKSRNEHTIQPHRAVLTAMSTTMGIGTIVAPVIAIGYGGPGALFGFLFTSFFGSAATFAEVKLCVEHRCMKGCGAIMGGPMQYLQTLISPLAAKWYAIFCFILMTAWSGAQSNQVAAILDSPLLGDYRIPKMISGCFISLFIVLLLTGGIKRIGSFSARLVPLMFTLYVSSSLWIICSNLDLLGSIFAQMWQYSFSPYELSTGAFIGGLVSSTRWGVFKGIQVSEAGIGTQTIPHSMAEAEDPTSQATLAMLSTYTAGFIAFLSGCVALITKTWADPDLPLGISMVAASFNQYFSSFGVGIVCLAALLFGFGTILGNSYNGSQCYNYLTRSKGAWCYIALTAIMVFIGAISEVKLFWSFSDIILACMALLHMAGLLINAYKKPETALGLQSS